MLKRKLQVFGAVIVFGVTSAAITSTAVAYNGSAQSSDFGFDPSSQNSGSDDGGWSSIDSLRQGGGSNFDNGNSTSNSVPDQVVKRVWHGKVLLLKVHYGSDGRWVPVAYKVLGNAPVTSTSAPTPSTSASDSRTRHRRGFGTELKDDFERGIRNGGKQIVRDGVGSIEDRLFGNGN